LEVRGRRLAKRPVCRLSGQNTRLEPVELRVLYVFVATIIPWKPMLLIRPEALEKRKFIVLVEPEGVSDKISVRSTFEGLESASKRVLQDIGIFSVCLKSHSRLDLLPNDIHNLRTSIDGKPEQDYFRVIE
jgi:hypothetical protein